MDSRASRNTLSRTIKLQDLQDAFKNKKRGKISSSFRHAVSVRWPSGANNKNYLTKHTRQTQPQQKAKKCIIILWFLFVCFCCCCCFLPCFLKSYAFVLLCFAPQGLCRLRCFPQSVCFSSSPPKKILTSLKLCTSSWFCCLFCCESISKFIAGYHKQHQYASEGTRYSGCPSNLIQ